MSTTTTTTPTRTTRLVALSLSRQDAMHWTSVELQEAVRIAEQGFELATEQGDNDGRGFWSEVATNARELLRDRGETITLTTADVIDVAQRNLHAVIGRHLNSYGVPRDEQVDALGDARVLDAILSGRRAMTTTELFCLADLVDMLPSDLLREAEGSPARYSDEPVTGGPSCPAWCTVDHSDDEQGQKHGEWGHQVQVLNDDGMEVEVIYCETPGRATVQGEDVAVFVEVPGSEGLGAGRALALAEAVIKAAGIVALTGSQG